MKLFSKNVTIAILVFIGAAVLYAMVASVLIQVPQVPLSEVVSQINRGEVVKIIIRENSLFVTKKDGSQVQSVKESDTALLETFYNYGVNQEKLREVTVEVKEPSGLSFWLGALLPILLPVILIGLFFWYTARSVQKGSMQAFTFGQSRARVIMPENKKEKVTFKDVAGVKEAKEELREVVDFLKNPKKFLDIGARIPRGVLLMGAPGTGKTLLARAVAGEASVPFFHLSGSEFVEMFVGVGASRVRDLFKLAKRSSPDIVFIDEIDAVGRHRGAGLGGGHDEREQTLNQILVEMDGFETDESVIVMAATNRPDVLDPALLRPGRFDRRVILDPPDINDREAILNIHTRNKALDKDINARRVAERTPGFSGADLANLVNEAAIRAARDNRKIISQVDLIESIDKVLLGPERKSHILSVEEKKISAYHEGGHSLVAAKLPNADPVHKVSIVSRGRAAGYTLKLPIEDRHLYSRSHFVDELAVLLGGYAAEKIVFKEITTGASDDLRKATDLARSLVTRYGMSDKIGPVTYGDRDEMVFLGKELGVEKNYSEKMASLIDGEVTKFIRGAHEMAKKIILENRRKLDEIAKTLVEKETIERDEFAKLIAHSVAA